MGKVAYDPKAEAEARANKAAAAADDIDDQTQETLPAIRQPMELGALCGDLQSSDIPVPWLQLSYGVGGLAEDFHPGSLVLDGKHLLVEKGNPLRVIILASQFYWKEYLSKDERDAGAKARAFITEKEVHAAGGTTDWGPNGEKPSFGRAVRLALLIEKPDNIACPYFTTKLGGREWAPARWNVDKSSYKRRGGKGVGPELIKTCKYVLNSRTELPEDKRLLAGLWEIKVAFEQSGGNNTPYPNLRLVGQNDAALIKEILDNIKL